MQNDNTYQTYGTSFVKDVPYENLSYLIKIFMDKASMNMGNEYNDKTLKGTIEIIKQYYSWIPVCYVASAFTRGSLGDFGAGRLVPRTVKAWMTETTNEYNLNQAKEKLKANENDVAIACDLHKYPIGQAIIKKLDWYKEGRLNGDLWDRVDLHALTEAIARKEYIQFENFFK